MSIVRRQCSENQRSEKITDKFRIYCFLCKVGVNCQIFEISTSKITDHLVALVAAAHTTTWLTVYNGRQAVPFSLVARSPLADIVFRLAIMRLRHTIDAALQGTSAIDSEAPLALKVVGMNIC